MSSNSKSTRASFDGRSGEHQSSFFRHFSNTLSSHYSGVNAVRKHFLDHHGCPGRYQDSFFRPFDSVREVKNNAKAVILAPLAATGCSLHYVQHSILLTSTGLVNLVFGVLTLDSHDIQKGSKFMQKGAAYLLMGVYWALSVVKDCMTALLCLTTHTLASLGFGMANIMMSSMTSDKSSSSTLSSSSSCCANM